MGSVRRWIQEVSLSPSPFPWQNNLTRGMTVNNPQSPHVGITLSTPPDEPERRTQAHAVLRISRHELLHASFQVYTCRCAVCTRDQALHRGTGLTGHGLCWVNVAAEIVKFVDRRGLNVGGSGAEKDDWLNIGNSAE